VSKKLPIISGKKLIKILAKLGFQITRQKGSHVILWKNDIYVTVPLHKEIKKGTLKAILKQANINLDEFFNALK